MKVDFFSCLADRNLEKYTVSRQDRKMFLDIINYLAPGFCYAQFLKAYRCSEEEGHFPYELVDSVEKLDATELPPHEVFYSSLKNENISTVDYHHCHLIWAEKRLTTMENFLIWYNKKVIEPLLEAIDKCFNFMKIVESTCLKTVSAFLDLH